MRKCLLIASISFTILSACKKNNDAMGEMNGSWKLIELYDKNTSTVSRKPEGSDLDVVITFLNSNTFAGHTLRNTLTEGTYSQSGNAITFGSFSMTKVGEDEWGSNFLTVLHACYLQAQMPCAPSSIEVRDNVMKITTSLRYDITLKRI